VAPGLHDAELRYLYAQEWVRTADDALWRRSKLGLRYTPQERAAVARWFDDNNDERHTDATDPRAHHQEGGRADVAP
jgi:glycerol-3-phosphate dehydrogenase